MQSVGSAVTTSRACPACRILQHSSHFKWYSTKTKKLYCSQECRAGVRSIPTIPRPRDPQ